MFVTRCMKGKKMDTELVNAIRELYFYEVTRTAGGFKTQLFDLIKKADNENKEKIRLGFPNEVEALELWNKAGNMGNDLFKKYGILL